MRKHSRLVASTGTVGIVLLTLSGGPPAAASTRFVAVAGSNANNDCAQQNNPCRTIQHALNVAASGETVELAADTFLEHVVIRKDITIAGKGHEMTTILGTNIDGSSPGRVIRVKGGVKATLSKLEIFAGQLTTANGAGIRNAGKLTLDHVSVSTNTTYASSQSGDGGGIYNVGILTITNSSIQNNTSTGEWWRHLQSGAYRN
jgi:hypothetical protein